MRSTIREWWRRLRGSLGGPRSDSDMAEELRFHAEMQRHEGKGPSPGELEQSLEAMRDQRGLIWLDGGLADLRQAVTALGRNRGFTLVTGAALAGAVALSALVFSIVEGVILKPLPYPAPDRLVRLFESSQLRPTFPLSIGIYGEYLAHSRTLENVSLYTGADVTLWLGDRSEKLESVSVTDTFLPTLGLRPALGRNFTAAELNDKSRVVLLSDRLWRSHYFADPAIVGRPIRLGKEVWTVIGVLPPGFQHPGGSYRSPLQGDTVELYLPLDINVKDGPRWQFHYTNALARLKPGVTPRQASDDLQAIVDSAHRRYPDLVDEFRAGIVVLSDEVVGKSRATLWLLAAAAVVVLLTACANLAGLFVARGLARRRESAIRVALGAGWWRLARVIVAENLVLGVAGGIAGLVLAGAAFPLLRAILPPEFPRLHEIHLTPWTALFSLLIALTTSLVAGVAPAMRQGGLDTRDVLHDASRSMSAGVRATRLRSLLVAAEAGLAALLCISALLLLRSSYELRERDHGFSPSHVLTFALTLPSPLPPAKEVARMYDEAVRQWSAVPGVIAAGIGTTLPWDGRDDNASFSIPGREGGQQRDAFARFNGASPDFFRALGIPIVRGRPFQDRDGENSEPVVLINEALAHKYFSSEDPLDRVLNLWGKKRRIAGVVRDVRDQPADIEAEPGFWLPESQSPFHEAKVAIRTAGDPLAVAPAILEAWRRSHPDVPVSGLRTMADRAAEALSERRFALWLFEVFAAMAVGLAAFGVYGLLVHIAQQRRKELGIRVALGASRASVVRMIVRDGALLAGTGIAIGTALAPISGRWLRTLLYGVTPLDPIALATGPVLLFLVAILAGFAPAWSVSRLEPMKVLREE